MYRINLAEAYYLAFHMNQDTDSKFRFESDHEWENFANTRISKKDPAFFLAAVLGYLFGNKTRARRKKVSKLKKAFEPYFIHGIKPNEVGAIVVKGGVPALTKKASEFFADNKGQEVHSSKKCAPEAQVKFTFNPGKFSDQLTDLDGEQVARGEFKIMRKSNGILAVKLVSLSATT
ncbi:hypothetical protein CQ059_16835 [Brucella pseudogrignonensis]|nr:hypothetical protein CQ059_16835 [Brucella pseudogrignonensis]PRA40367.1 hypothetical protein CQ063_12320 [Brucella pseudogrignonensis]PRA68960.1 hypothetical protein CQ055_12205 [Brucella pseudogrignonensis]